MMIAFMRDGFHPNSASGNIELGSHGSPGLDYHMIPLPGTVFAVSITAGHTLSLQPVRNGFFQCTPLRIMWRI